MLRHEWENRTDDRKTLMPIPIDERRKPASVKIHVSTGAGVDVVWSDGHVSHFDFTYLRENCPCATCNEERIKKDSLTETSPVCFVSCAADVQAEASRTIGDARGSIRDSIIFFRWSLDRDLFLRTSTHNLSVLGMFSATKIVVHRMADLDRKITPRPEFLTLSCGGTSF